MREGSVVPPHHGSLGPSSSPSPVSFPSYKILSHYLSPPQLKTLLNFFASWEVPALHESNLTFNCTLTEVGEGHCPLLDLTQVPQPHGLNPYDLAGRTGTKQLLFRQTPLDKCSTFNNKLCKPNAEQFLASKLDFFFKKWGKVQVISVLSGKTKIKTNKLHLAPLSEAITASVFFFFFFFSSNGVTSRRLCLPISLRVRFGWGRRARQTPVWKAISGANASQFYRLNRVWGFLLVDNWPASCEEDATISTNQPCDQRADED